MTELPTFSRRARYAWAAALTLINALTVGTAIAYGIYHLLLWAITTSAGPGQIAFIRDLPGPFTGWLSHAAVYWLVFLVTALPKAMVRAHRNEYYPRPKPKAPRVESV